MKKFTSNIILLLLVGSVFVYLSQVSLVKASETIYVRADGNVEGTDKIYRNGNVYTFTDNINGSIVVERGIRIKMEEKANT